MGDKKTIKVGRDNYYHRKEFSKPELDDFLLERVLSYERSGRTDKVDIQIVFDRRSRKYDLYTKMGEKI